MLKPKKAVPSYVHAAAVIVQKGKVLLAQRPSKGLLGGMWEFPNTRVVPQGDDNGDPAKAFRALALALLTFVFAAVAIAVLSMALKVVRLLPAGWTWSHGLLLGSILGGSSSIVIMPAMAQAKVPARLANLVGLESAFTDAFCVVGAATLISLLTPAAASVATTVGTPPIGCGACVV